MVMPRSRSRSIESSSCGRCLRASTAPVTSRMRSASVDLPWSMWAMIEKLRMFRSGALLTGSRLGAPEAAAQQPADLPRLLHPQHEDARDVDGQPERDSDAEARQLAGQRAAEGVVEGVPNAERDRRQRRGRGKHLDQGAERATPLDPAEV